MKPLTVLYDPHCPACVHAWRWFARRRVDRPIEFVPQGTTEAHARFPALRVGEGEPIHELIVVDEEHGGVRRGGAALAAVLRTAVGLRPVVGRLGHDRYTAWASGFYRWLNRQRCGVGRCLPRTDARVPPRIGPPTIKALDERRMHELPEVTR
ncbi:MAG: DCC1-like thiol-disulfide oxidoreductase family protein [Planctomycetota bacterium]